MKKMMVFLLFFLCAITTIWATDAEPGPILLPSVNSHESAISAIAVDESGHEVVTASWDGSIIQWDARTGDYKSRVLLPRNYSEQGRIESLDINHRTRLVAVGGRSTVGSPSGYTMFFVDLSTGSIANQRTFNNEIKSIIFSRDGSYLAVLTNGEPALHLISGPNFSREKEIKLPANLGDIPGTAIAWSPDGRLAFASTDSIYILEREDRNAFKISKEEKLDSTEQITCMSWSSDSTLLAMAYGNTPSIEIRDSATLSLKEYPDIRDVFKDIYTISFSNTGSKLLAGGRYSDGTSVKIRIWTKNGLGNYKDIAASDNTIFSMVSGKDGTVYFGSGEPAWGLVTPDDSIKYWSARKNLDLRSSRNTLDVNVDATVVRFNKNISPFSILTQSNTDADEAIYSSVQPKKIEYDNSHNILHWGGKRLELPIRALPICFTEVFDGKALLVGCDTWICLYTKDSRQVWAVPAPYVWGLTASGNEAVVIAGLGDGTIRWYGIDSGDLLLSFLPSKHENEWLMWNPKGTYTAGSAIDQSKRFGWITQKSNNEAAVFHKADDFRQKYEKPDEVLSILWQSEGTQKVPYKIPLISYITFVVAMALLFLLGLPGYILGWFPSLGVLSGFENRKTQVMRASITSFFLAALLMAIPFLLRPTFMNGGQLSRMVAMDIVPAYYALTQHALFDSILGLGAWLVPGGLWIWLSIWSYRMLFDTREKSSQDGEKSDREHIFVLDLNARDELRQF